MIYAGIGSRETPQHVLSMMIDIGRICAEKGDILRSGAAGGADSAFEAGCDQAGGPKQIYIPWDGFANRRTKQDPFLIVGGTTAAQNIAEQFHPNWAACSRGARALHARNVMQVLGHDLNTPADLIICWTKNGAGQGGTGQALRIARHYNIKIHDLGIPEILTAYEAAIKEA